MTPGTVSNEPIETSTASPIETSLLLSTSITDNQLPDKTSSFKPSATIHSTSPTSSSSIPPQARTIASSIVVISSTVLLITILLLATAKP